MIEIGILANILGLSAKFERQQQQAKQQITI